MKKVKKAIFRRYDLQKTRFLHFMRFFGVEKFFGRQNRVFQPFLPLEMMFLKKKIFSKNLPKKGQKVGFFLGHPVMYKKYEKCDVQK